MSPLTKRRRRSIILSLAAIVMTLITLSVTCEEIERRADESQDEDVLGVMVDDGATQIAREATQTAAVRMTQDQQIDDILAVPDEVEDVFVDPDQEEAAPEFGQADPDLPEEGSGASGPITVALLPGNAGELVLPDFAAYGNVDFPGSSPQITVVDNCGADCWRHNGWIAIYPGHFLEATYHVPVAQIIVQLWGDQDDGFGRILLDGQPVWEGDTYGKEPNLFIHYLSISGISPTKHVVRVEHVSGGPVTIWFFGAVSN